MVCSRDDNCPDCENGDKPSYKGAYLLVDLRPYEYTDSKGKKKEQPCSIRFYLPGIRVVSSLERISSKYGLMNRVVNIARSGRGQNTTYHIDRTDDESDFTTEELRDLLVSDEIKKLYNGNDEDIYKIIEQQLDVRLSSISDDEDEDKENDGRDAIVKRRSFGSKRNEEKETEKPAKKRKPFKAWKKDNSEDDDLPF